MNKREFSGSCSHLLSGEDFFSSWRKSFHCWIAAGVAKLGIWAVPCEGDAAWVIAGGMDGATVPSGRAAFVSLAVSILWAVLLLSVPLEPSAMDVSTVQCGAYRETWSGGPWASAWSWRDGTITGEGG